MVNITKRTSETAALLAVLYCARRYYRNWGATKAECQMRLPGDTLVSDPVIQTTEAVNIDAPASVVWPWLLQMGLQPESQQLAVGDVIRPTPEGWLRLPTGMKLTIAEIVPEKYVVLDATQSNRRWNAVLSFHLQPHWEDRVRLLIRARIALRHPGEVFVMELARPLMALGARGLLLGIKRRAERPASVRVKMV
ncbi:SRPBCC family protein [Mycobacterium sp.]|uniref:SRPBCC family protein n=1 Tax=Mycobacterium sp. TaxID=1785 RepID=UPI003C74EC33